MTTWNYRVIKSIAADSLDVIYQIHEVYYHKDGSIDCWSSTPVEPLGVSEPGLRNDIQAFLVAFRLPVLELRYINGKAKLIAEKIGRSDHDLHADYTGKTARASDYINQILGNHLLLKQQPSVRQAFEKVDAALAELHALVSETPQLNAAV